MGIKYYGKPFKERAVQLSYEQRIYGAARISLELSSTATPLSKTTVAKYMHGLGLKSCLRRKVGFDYFKTVMDLFDRKIIGWSFVAT